MKKHLLVIEDDEMIQAFIALHMENEGFVVSKASTGGEGLKAFADEDIDIILLDLNLPDSDGLEIAQEIRKNSLVPIIILTARTGETDRIFGLSLGVVEYLTKPIDPQELSLWVHNLLDRCNLSENMGSLNKAQVNKVICPNQSVTGGGELENTENQTHRILVADDDELVTQLIEFKLRKEGYEVTGIGDGIGALDHVFENKPDLIVLDRMMPGMDGVEVLRRLKENPETKNIFVVMVTARGMERDITSALDMGADDYMVKPFMTGELISRIKRLLNNKRLA